MGLCATIQPCALEFSTSSAVLSPMPHACATDLSTLHSGTHGRDRRAELIAELARGARTFKVLGWEPWVGGRLAQARELEAKFFFVPGVRTIFF